MMIYFLSFAASAAGPSLGIWDSIVHDFSNITEPAAFSAFLQVLMIDIVLAGDNAIVVGALAAGLPADQRKKVIFIGVLAALVLRVAFALVVTQLMQIVGLIFVVGAFWRPDLAAESLGYKIIEFVSVPEHFSRYFTRGQIDTRHLIAYATVTLFCFNFLRNIVK